MIYISDRIIPQQVYEIWGRRLDIKADHLVEYIFDDAQAAEKRVAGLSAKFPDSMYWIVNYVNPAWKE